MNAEARETSLRDSEMDAASGEMNAGSRELETKNGRSRSSRGALLPRNYRFLLDYLG